jgi:mannose-6-phosphate isomerase-like protein (cupin superfamily)
MVRGRIVQTTEERSISMDTVNITRANEGEHWLVLNDVTTVKASGSNTSGKLLVLNVAIPPGGGPPVLHRHEYSEVFLFQKGEFEVSTVDEHYALNTFEVGAGETVSIISMVWHNFKNVGEASGIVTTVHSPVVTEDFIREMGRQINDPDQPPAPDSTPSDQEVQRMMEIIGRYMEMLPSEDIGR